LVYPHRKQGAHSTPFSLKVYEIVEKIFAYSDLFAIIPALHKPKKQKNLEEARSEKNLSAIQKKTPQ
jgi:hypothetical protein